jgi:bifunctional non-homologous end joining protein LigD
MPAATEVTVDGRTLRLTNLDKVLYPGNGFTKADVIDYYRSVAPVMLPHLRDMCPTLVRAPNGVNGQVFFEKRCPPHHPDWIVEGPANGVPNACVIDTLPHLVWTANLAALELHVQQTPRAALRTPRAMVFDLDPGPDTDILDCRRVAHQLRDFLERLGLTVVLVKTSGSKGLHLSVPLNPQLDSSGADAITDDDTKKFALALGQLLEQRDERVTTNMAKDQRGGRVFVDWSQNDRHKTTIAPYSLRIRELPTVSTPITWDELDAAPDATALVFDAPMVMARVESDGDFWADALTVHQQLPALS